MPSLRPRLPYAKAWVAASPFLVTSLLVVLHEDFSRPKPERKIDKICFFFAVRAMLEIVPSEVFVTHLP
jgi:hypothetical protein